MTATITDDEFAKAQHFPADGDLSNKIETHLNELAKLCGLFEYRHATGLFDLLYAALEQVIKNLNADDADEYVQAFDCEYNAMLASEMAVILKRQIQTS